ncbi:sensor histidine kinase [Flavisphingomonas formosensis]|uniref:sensor histidine kinase n=1 Tax=Flavisphingomonas formosensis TaxID=861534 RepID=UPI0012F70AA3|nr:HAMP domain-containing sensor histidine kinase [Sphingomonas formosensis]
MIARCKAWVKRHWPPLHLRTILFLSLFFVAALPGVSAVFLRVYENTLVRQTEAELVAQGAALASAAQLLWPGAPPPALVGRYDVRPEPPRIDLNATPILPPRPSPAVVPGLADAVALGAGQQLAPIFAATRRTTLAAIVLLDGSGRVVTGMESGKSYAALPEVRAALAGRPDTVLRRNESYRARYPFEWLSRAAAIRVHHARPIVVEGHVVGVLLLSRSARALFKGIYEDRGKILLGMAAILLILVLLSGVLSRGIAKPIEALGAATREVATGRGQVPDPPQTAAIEIQGLYLDFAAMAEAIEHRSRYLRDFAHAMSHEFKTPLAGIRGVIELLQDHDAAMAPEERRRFLANADADAERLATLVTRLLELARADMARVGSDARADLPTILAKVADALAAGNFSIDVDASGDVPLVAVPEAMLEAILVTLVQNSRQAGARHALLEARAEDEAVRLRISDDGPGIAAGDRARIFEPFFTTRRAQGGSGLGLAIVRSLLDAANGSIHLVDNGAGATFDVMLPRRT